MRKIIVTEMSTPDEDQRCSIFWINFLFKIDNIFLVIFETLKNKQGRICAGNRKYEKLKPRIQIQTFHDSWTSVSILVHKELLVALFKYILRAYTIEMK